MAFVDLLDAQIALRPLLKHPFYVRWQQGEISREELQGYAKEYYPFERAFPCFVSAIHSRCDSPEIRQQLLENLLHEEKGEKNHAELWLRFAEGLGVSREQARENFHSDETEFLLRTFRRLTQSEHLEEGLAALYAYERQQPQVAATKIEGLRELYALTEERALEFFRVHQVYDIEHSETEGRLLERVCQDPASRKRAVDAVEQACHALYEFLDGVQRRYQRSAA